jgi:MFS family permease
MNTTGMTGNLPPASEKRLPAATYLLFLCQAVNLTAAVISVTIAPLVGAKLAPDRAWATVPYGVQFAMVALCTYPAAMMMRRFGRKCGFVLGALLLIAAGCAGFQAVVNGSFAGLIGSHALLGAYVAFANFYRFAAVDNLSAEMRPRGISLVVAGGMVAALTGPLVSIGLQDYGGYTPYSLCYAFFIVLGVVTIALLGIWRTTEAAQLGAASVPSVSPKVSASIVLAVFASASAYLIMNLLMVQASLVMESMCVSFNAGTFAIQAHVLAMFAPSFITGAVVARIGFRNVLLAGFAMISAAALLGMWNTGFAGMVAGLLFLGCGWNFSYVGGGALLARHLTNENRHRLQGANDSIIAICATLGAFAPAVLQASIGWRNTNLLCLVICLVGCALAYMTLPASQPE